MVANLMVFYILYLAGPSWEQSIEWIDPYKIYGMYYQPGLIQRRDAIILYGQIDLRQTTGYDRVHYEIKKRNMDYSTLCYLYMTKCEGYKNSFCYCKTTSKSDIFEVVINITADTSLSEAKVKGAMDTYEKKIISVEKNIPKIYDGTNIQVNMYVNGIIGNASKCHMEITGNDVCIAIEIPDIVNLQYQLVLKNVRTNMVLRNESKSVFYSTQVMDTLQLAVLFHVYDLPGSQQQFQCFIQAKLPDERDNPFSVLFGFTLAFLVILTVLVIVAILCRKRLLSYIQSKKTRKPSRPFHNVESISEYVNVQNMEASSPLIFQQGQDDENAEEMVCSSTIEFAEEKVLIPMEIIEKIKEIKQNKENKKKILEKIKEKVLRNNAESKYDLLKDLARCQVETMVSVKVEKVSSRRPKSLPGTKEKYHLSGKTKWKRFGFGRIINVRKFNKDHRRKSHILRAFQSSLFSKVESGTDEWVEVLVYVSRHLVFDDLEAEDTTCTLMMHTNLPDTIQFQRGIVRLANVIENWTLLTFYSKDVSIYNNLNENINMFNQTWKGLDISHLISFIVYYHDMKLKKLNFADMFEIFSKDKRLRFCFNTYFEKQSVAIFFERANASIMRMYQKESGIDALDGSDLSNVNLNLELSSMPFIVKKKKKVKSSPLEAQSYGHC